MNEIIQMDIFFFIASVGFILVTILLTIALIYLIILFRNLKRIVSKAAIQAENLSQDIDDLRQNVRQTGLQLVSAIKFFSTIIKRIMKGK
jgi:hypothetical protein